MNPLVVGDYGTWAIKIFFVGNKLCFWVLQKDYTGINHSIFFFFELRQKGVIKTILGSEINQNL